MILSDQLALAKNEGVSYIDYNSTQATDIEAKKMIQKINKKRNFEEIECFACGKIPFTLRHLMWIKYREDSNEGRQQDRYVLACYVHPNRRTQDIFGDVGQMIDNAIFVNSDNLLVNFATYENACFFQNQYWTMIDTNGQIQEIDKRINSLKDHHSFFYKCWDLANGEKFLIFRKGTKHKLEKRVQQWRSTGSIKLFDTAERLRQLESEKQFCFLVLNKDGSRKKEVSFITKSLRQHVKKYLQDNLNQTDQFKGHIQAARKSVKLTNVFQVGDTDKVYRIATFVKPDEV